MTQETEREAIERRYRNGGLTYSDFVRQMNEAAVKETVEADRTGTLRDDGGDGGEGQRRAEEGNGPA